MSIFIHHQLLIRKVCYMTFFLTLAFSCHAIMKPDIFIRYNSACKMKVSRIYDTFQWKNNILIVTAFQLYCLTNKHSSNIQTKHHDLRCSCIILNNVLLSIALLAFICRMFLPILKPCIDIF